MLREEIKQRQDEERNLCLRTILDSTAPKKLIVAGAGTGKTFTFSELLKLSVGGNNLAMTFIRKLIADLEVDLGSVAEVKTFHAYCKKVLHEQFGRVYLVPFLTKIIESDAVLLGKSFEAFDTKIRTLEEGSPEIDFYLRRGNYYEVVGFDDSVYRVYKAVKNNPDILPDFDQIVIDEFQDFNPLEVAFINELAKKGNILIVGDDDQAVYDGRSASPAFLRELYNSRTFARFELPFCSRCPEVIVAAINSLVGRAQRAGHFKDRIAKRYECYLNEKEADSLKYPKIILVQCTTATVVARYIENEISNIDPIDIAQSHRQCYPTVLVVGSKQYLLAVEKQLSETQVSYSSASTIDYGLIDGYELLLRNERSNLGWRIITEFFFEEEVLKDKLAKSTTGGSFIDLLDLDFIERHLRALEIIRAIQDGGELTTAEKSEFEEILDSYSNMVCDHFLPVRIDKVEIDSSKPTILLTSFKGCKGLSAGHVFIVGAHNGALPTNARDIQDVEISQFIVALSRTRKQCHILSNKWLVGPVDKKGKYVKPFPISHFVSWIRAELIENRGLLKASDLR